MSPQIVDRAAGADDVGEPSGVGAAKLKVTATATTWNLRGSMSRMMEAKTVVTSLP